MTDKRILDYIKSAMLSGMQMEQIKSNLLAAGWNENDVNKAINSVYGIQEPKPLIERNIPFVQETYVKEKKPLKINTTLMLIATIVVIAIILFAWWFFTRPVCGNGKLEKGETPETCCEDAGCLGEQTCTEEGCIEPTCGACQYLENHVCKDYECCENDDCSSNERCQNHECISLNCSYCQYILNHTCTNYTCCNDTDCDDNNSTTIDRCNNPRTLSALCIHLINECNNDSDCNDNLNSTRDICSGTPKICLHINITNCTNNDNYCPPGCDYNNDTDCLREIINCGTDINCFLNAGNSLALANVTNTTNYEVSGINITETNYYEIRGNESNKLIVYFQYNDFKINFTSALIQAINDSGKSLPEVYQIERDAQANATLRIGNYGTCKLNSTLFIEWIVNGNLKGGCNCTLIANNWNCTAKNEKILGNCTGNYFC